MVGYYLIGLLYDSAEDKLAIKLAIGEILLVLCIIKTFWGSSTQSFYSSNSLRIILIVLSVIVKILVILAIGLCLNYSSLI